MAEVETVRCNEVGGDDNNQNCTYDKEHKGPHSWDREALAEQSKVDVARSEKDNESAKDPRERER